MALKTLIGEPLREALRRQGWDVEKPSVGRDSNVRRVALMRDLGIETVLDVGANVGHYGQDLRRSGYTGRIVSVEPLSGAYARLVAAAAQDPSWNTLRLALGANDGEAQINIADDEVWSSLLPRDGATRTQRNSSSKRETIRTARLDSLEVLDGTPTWLKLDVQGYELEALEGAERSLPQISAVECEMSVEPFYEGQPSIRQVIDVLDDQGFRLTAVDNGHVRRDSGRAMWIDGIFIRA